MDDGEEEREREREMGEEREGENAPAEKAVTSGVRFRESRARGREETPGREV